ncbi:hypothetical protein BASA62_008382 [Batrachochytrium salamandrivorans]|nr:hypothetical protein BASA62_008382 [Batrachochytrium salamandrivorans]
MRSRGALKRMGDLNIGDIHCQLAPACATCSFDCCYAMWSHIRLQGRVLMQYIKIRLYKVNDDQVAVVMARLDEAGQTPLQSLSNPALATKRGSSQQDPHKAARQS